MRFAGRALGEAAVVVSVAQNIGAVGFAAVVDFIAAILLIHIVLRRQWPPYKAVHPGLILYTGLAVSGSRINPVAAYIYGDSAHCLLLPLQFKKPPAVCFQSLRRSSLKVARVKRTNRTKSQWGTEQRETQNY